MKYGKKVFVVASFTKAGDFVKPLKVFEYESEAISFRDQEEFWQDRYDLKVLEAHIDV